MIGFGADLDSVFRDLAVDVEHASGTLRGVMRYDGANALGISGQSPTVLLRDTDAAAVAIDDELVVMRAADPEPLPEVFRVVSKRRSIDARVVEGVLVRRGIRVDFVQGDDDPIGLSAIYIDQQHPNFPAAQDPELLYDPEIRLRNQGGGRQRRGFVSFGPLIGPAGPLPSSARILDATLYAVSEQAQSGTWAVWRVLQGQQIATTSWLVFRTGAPWATAGAGAIGIDYQTPALATGVDLPVGEFVVASGAAFVGAVEATKASTCRLRLTKTGAASADELVFSQYAGLRLRVYWGTA